MITERPWWSLLWFTDPHVSSVAPASRLDDYENSVLDKLHQIQLLAEKLKVDRMICGGDVWHHRSPSKTTHETIQKMIQLWRNNPPLGIVGNHDLPWNILERMDLDRQPLGVLIKAGVYEIFNSEPEKRIGPFLIKGLDYREEPLRPEELTFTGIAPVRILLVHQYASMTGDSMMKEVTYSYPYLVERSNADIICLGHWHLDQGIEKMSRKSNPGSLVHVVNVGSVARTSMSRDALVTHPKCVLIRYNEETAELQLCQIKLRVNPVEKIFNLNVHRDRKSREVDFQKFLEQLGTKNDFTFDVEQLIRSQTTDKSVQEEAIRLFRESQRNPI